MPISDYANAFIFVRPMRVTSGTASRAIAVSKRIPRTEGAFVLRKSTGFRNCHNQEEARRVSSGHHTRRKKQKSGAKNKSPAWPGFRSP